MMMGNNMNKDRLQQEIEAQQELILYNFYARINKELKSGSIDDVIELIWSYHEYINVQIKLIKIGGNK